MSLFTVISDKKIRLQLITLFYIQLDHILPNEVKEAWTKLLEILEDRNRTLTNVQHGSLLLTLFCPNPGAQQQLQFKNGSDI